MDAQWPRIETKITNLSNTSPKIKIKQTLAEKKLSRSSEHKQWD